MEMDMLETILFDPFNENRDFRCDLCSKYLSIAPILFHESVGKICGRCVQRGETKKYSHLTLETQTVYERIAKHLIYPCSFRAKGCKEKLEWNQVSKHEDSCYFKENICPFRQEVIIFDGKKCDWTGDDNSLLYHLRETHTGFFSDFMKMTLHVSDPKSNISISNFMEIPAVAILFVTKDLKNIYFHLFMHTVLQCDAHTYDLEVSDEMGKHKMVFPENRVVPLCERAFTANDLKNGFNLDIAGLQALLRNDCLNFWFKIKSKQSHLLADESGLSSNQHLIFDHKCGNCEKILTDAIYLCYNAHNICKNCYDTINYCKCEQRISSDRNQALENLSKISLYECKNKNEGCSKLVDSKKFKFHEANCKLTSKKCVMECGWSGNNAEMLNHLKEAHTKINLNEDNEWNSPTLGLQQFFTVLNGIIFLLSITYDSNKTITVEVKYLEPEVSEIYKFEFLFMSGKLKLECCHYCHPFIYGDEEDKSPAIVYPSNFLKQFLLEQNKFHFRVNIFS